MANLRALLFVAVAALVIAPAAANATPLAPTATIAGFAVTQPAGPIPLGSTAVFNVTLTSVTLTNTICQANSAAAVTITMASNGPAGVTGTPPASIPIVFAANAAGSTSAVATRAGSDAIVVSVSVAPNAAPNHDHTFTLNATYTGPTTGCSNSAATGQDPQATHTVSTSLSIKTGPGASNTSTTGTGPNPTNGSTAPTSEKASPLADVPTVALMVLGVALVVSRRKK